jgi:hypothetical protein
LVESFGEETPVTHRKKSAGNVRRGIDALLRAAAPCSLGVENESTSRAFLLPDDTP